MNWFRKTSPEIVDTPIGKLSLDYVIIRRDYPLMFICKNEGDTYYAFWEVENNAYYEQWYCTSIPFWLRNKVRNYNDHIRQIWDVEERYYSDLTYTPEYFYLRHWFENDNVDINVTEDKPFEEICDNKWEY